MFRSNLTRVDGQYVLYVCDSKFCIRQIDSIEMLQCVDFPQQGHVVDACFRIVGQNIFVVLSFAQGLVLQYAACAWKVLCQERVRILHVDTHFSAYLQDDKETILKFDIDGGIHGVRNDLVYVMETLPVYLDQRSILVASVVYALPQMCRDLFGGSVLEFAHWKDCFLFVFEHICTHVIDIGRQTITTTASIPVPLLRGIHINMISETLAMVWTNHQDNKIHIYDIMRKQFFMPSIPMMPVGPLCVHLGPETLVIKNLRMRCTLPDGRKSSTVADITQSRKEKNLLSDWLAAPPGRSTYVFTKDWKIFVVDLCNQEPDKCILQLINEP